MANDDKVLAFMFDPFLLETMENETQAKLEAENDELSDEQIKAKTFEMDAIKLANDKKYEDALNKFEDALKAWPDRASIYNNRAQTFRLINKIHEAKLDLDTAISLSDNATKVNELVARQAYCQRAQIWMLWNKENEGMKDIKRAAELGSGWAKTFVAKTNPYAALCNQMLHEMFQQCGVKQ